MQAAEVGAAKANLPLTKTFVLAILGGVFLSVGGTLAMSVGPACPGMLESNPGLLKLLTGKSDPYAQQFNMSCSTSFDVKRWQMFGLARYLVQTSASFILKHQVRVSTLPNTT